MDQITTNDVLAVLIPIWHKTPDTASCVRGRIEIIIDAAKARGFRDGENPARWRGHLAHLLPPRKKLMRGYIPAVAIDDVPALIKAYVIKKPLKVVAIEADHAVFETGSGSTLRHYKKDRMTWLLS